MGIVQELGFGVGALYAADRLAQKLSPNLRVIGYHVVAQPVHETPGVSGYSYRVLSPGDPHLEMMPTPADVRSARFGQGARCLGTFNAKGELVAYAWFVLGSYDEDEVQCTYLLPPNCAWDLDVYVFPKYRMGRAFYALWAGANDFLLEHFITHTYSRIAMTNRQSLQSHKRLGAKRVGSAVFLRAWGVQLMLSTLAPYVSLSQWLRPRLLLILN